MAITGIFGKLATLGGITGLKKHPSLLQSCKAQHPRG